MERETSSDSSRADLQQPVSAGIIAALVGYTSSFAVVLTGLTAVGATARQAASGPAGPVRDSGGRHDLAQRAGTGCRWCWCGRRRASRCSPAPRPSTAAGRSRSARSSSQVPPTWSPACGRRWGGSSPASRPPIAQAMLAGVVLELCLAPVTALQDNPGAILPIALVWLLGVRLGPALGRPGCVPGRRRGDRCRHAPARHLDRRVGARARAVAHRAAVELGGDDRHRAAAVHRDDGIAERSWRRDHEVAGLRRPVARLDRDRRRRHDGRCDRGRSLGQPGGHQRSPRRRAAGRTGSGAAGGSRRSRPRSPISSWRSPRPPSPPSSRSHRSASSRPSQVSPCSAPWPTRSTARCPRARGARPRSSHSWSPRQASRSRASAPRSGPSSRGLSSTLSLHGVPGELS